LHETKNEAEARYYEAEAEAKNLALRPCWPRGLNIPGNRLQRQLPCVFAVKFIRDLLCAQLKDMKHAALPRIRSSVDGRASTPATTGTTSETQVRDQSSPSPPPQRPSVSKDREEQTGADGSIHFTFSPAALAALKERSDSIVAEDSQHA